MYKENHAPCRSCARRGFLVESPLQTWQADPLPVLPNGRRDLCFRPQRLGDFPCVFSFPENSPLDFIWGNRRRCLFGILFHIIPVLSNFSPHPRMPLLPRRLPRHCSSLFRKRRVESASKSIRSSKAREVNRRTLVTIRFLKTRIEAPASFHAPSASTVFLYFLRL